MNTTDFTYILQHPEAITGTQTDALETVLKEFPYFQSARALHLKGLKSNDSFKYNQALKTTAAYTADRSILFDFITSEVFLQNEISEHIKLNLAHLRDIEVDIEDISINKKVSLDDTFKQQVDDTEGVLDPELFQPKSTNTTADETSKTLSKTEQDLVNRLNLSQDYQNIQQELETGALNETEPNTKDSPEATLNIGKPLEFNKTETHSFSEWLKLTQFKPIERDETVVEVKETPKHEVSPKQKKFDLIDKFIKTNPKIQPEKTNKPNIDLGQLSVADPESLTTETLARIYIEQGHYKKAIQAFKILSLKYPEKSSLFADQIQAVKRLQNKH